MTIKRSTRTRTSLASPDSTGYVSNHLSAREYNSLSCYDAKIQNKQQAAQYDQLSKFLREFAPYAANASFSVEPVAGGANPQSNDVPSGEANMDMQYAIAMAYNVPVRFYATGGANHDFIPDLE